MKVGDRVGSPLFGTGTVVEIDGPDKVAVLFDSGDRRLLALDFAGLRMLDPEQEALRKERDLAEYSATFAEPEGDEEHVHGDHWDTVGIPVSEILNFLPGIMKDNHVFTAPAGLQKHGYELPLDEPVGFSLISPDKSAGVIAVCKEREGSGPNEAVSIFPWIGAGTVHVAEIEQVHPWSTRLEGQITVNLGPGVGIEMAFFDAGYVWCRKHYRRGRRYRFMLAGYAYSCRRAIDPQPITITAPETLRGLNEISGREPDDMTPIEIRMEGMAALIPHDKGDRDDFSFRGPVKDIQPVDFLGQPLWRLVVTTCRSMEDDGDLDLAVFVHDEHFKQSGPPSVGDDVEGVLWLQGWLHDLVVNDPPWTWENEA